MKTNSFKKTALAIIICILSITLVGCKAKPVPDSGFIKNPEMMKETEFLPFTKAWKDKSINFKKYNKIMVAPIFTKAQLDKSWLEKSNLYYYLGKDDEQLAEFADYTTEALKKAVKKDPKFGLANKPGPNTVLLELALVKVVPGKPIIKAAENAGSVVTPILTATPVGFVIIPVKFVAKSASDGPGPTDSSVAIEGRIRDSMTKKVIATFADRRKQKTAFFNLKDFSAYGNPKQLVDEWAEQIIEALNSNMGKDAKIEKKSSSTIINL